MNEQRIEPHKVTKPIQLLAAWLVGLILTNGTFLITALKVEPGTWERSALVISAIANVPLFLIALFVLQTRFRAELQEDSYYSTYLNQKTNKLVTVEKETVRSNELLKRVDVLESRISSAQEASVAGSKHLSSILFGINKNLPDRDKIKSRLAERGISKCTSFGTDELPDHRVVSISQYLSQEELDEVLHAVSHVGFQHYRLYDNALEESEEDVLIGSYGDPQYEILSRRPNNALQATCEDARA